MDNSTNPSKSNKKHKKHSRRHFAVLPYLTTPLLFVLISMIVIGPACVIGMNFAVNTVHKAQKTLAIDYNDIQPIDDYVGSDKVSGEVDKPNLNVSQKMGIITCENAGLNADVYYGINRVSLRNGVALEADGKLCGEGGKINVYGYALSNFKALNNADVNDIIHFETLWGTYEYKVTSKTVASSIPDTGNSETLVLVTAKDSDAFSDYGYEKLYVVAKLVSGPTVKEVA